MNDKEKAEVQSSFLTSVFTKENMKDIPDVPSKKFDAVLKDVKVSKTEQGWVSSGRNVFIPGRLEETGK